MTQIQIQMKDPKTIASTMFRWGARDPSVVAKRYREEIADLLKTAEKAERNRSGKSSGYTPEHARTLSAKLEKLYPEVVRELEALVAGGAK